MIEKAGLRCTCRQAEALQTRPLWMQSRLCSEVAGSLGQETRHAGVAEPHQAPEGFQQVKAGQLFDDR